MAGCALQEPKPIVSVIHTTYNYETSLGRAIDSALLQSYAHVEIVVVDDGSTDGSRRIIAAYDDDRIKPVLKQNGGQASAFNAGFAASSGEIVCFLDSDDVWHIDKVDEVVKVFGSESDIGWVFHALGIHEENGQKIDRTPEYGTRRCDYRAAILKGRLKFRTPATSGICFRRDLLKQILPMPAEEGIALSDSY